MQFGRKRPNWRGSIEKCVPFFYLKRSLHAAYTHLFKMSEINVVEKLSELLTAYFAQEGNEGLFLVDISINRAREILVHIDSDNGLLIDQAAKISRHLEHHLDEKLWLGDDYTLDVSSPGVGNPLRLHRQYVNNIGRELSVELLDTYKNAKGILTAVDEEGITLEYSERVQIEGTKKKQMLDLKQQIPFANIKKAVVKISFK